MFSASDVKDLREKTGAGMMDCKKALQECEGNMEKAIDWLREKGIAKAAKKESRIAAEGLCQIKAEGNVAVMVEVNSETDFVAKNPEFTGFVDYLVDMIINNDVNTIEDVTALEDGGETVGDKLVALTAKIGEKLSFRRFEKVTKADDEVFGTYKHLGGKIGTIIVLKGGTEEVAKDVAMQAAAMNPIALVWEDVPADVVEKEKHFITEEVKKTAEGKPEAVIEKMVVGKLEKFYKEVVLTEQAFIKENKISIAQYVKDNNTEVLSMVRFAEGEGIEMRQENFADEVMSQINAA